jgi:CBS domain-containing protein
MTHATASRAPARPAPRPVVSIQKGATVMDAVRAMVERNVGATAVLDDKRLVGVFTERDVVTRVVLRRLDPDTTPVAEVMTTRVLTVREETDRSTVLRLMSENHIRHLPVVDSEGVVLTMLSMRHLLRAEVNDLEQTVWELVAETAIDGAGG